MHASSHGPYWSCSIMKRRYSLDAFGYSVCLKIMLLMSSARSVGRPTERALLINSMIFKHTEYPNASKEYLRFMMEQDQYGPWLEACIGYWGHPLKAYENSPVWT